MSEANFSSEFKEFPKMARLSREIIVTEKIDGTNAQIFIQDEPNDVVAIAQNPEILAAYDTGGGFARTMRAGSRTRWLGRKTDNFGFAMWVQENAQQLFTLGEGRHFGEWWGSGVQRGYGLPKGEKRFSLFNSSRWMDSHAPDRHKACGEKQEWAPSCCHVVPILWQGAFDTGCIDECIFTLARLGSVAAPGFMKPEGIVIFHTAGNVGFKKTVEKDEVPKSTYEKGR